MKAMCIDVRKREFAAAICGAVLLAGGTAFGAASVFEAKEAENGAYDGTVKSGGDGN